MTASALIFANGELNDGPAVWVALQLPSPRLVIAADAGLRHVARCGLKPNLVIGDMDSVYPPMLAEAQQHGAEILRYPSHKDETDLELALLAAVERDCQTIRILGGLGNRLDQTFGNVFLLALAALQDCDTRLVDGRQSIWLMHPGNNVITGEPGDTVSLIPLTDSVTEILTHDLEYPLRRETLRIGPARGISNVMQNTEAHVEFKTGLLLAVHTIGRA